MTIKLLSICVASIASSFTAYAEIKMPVLFTDGMVLQQKSKVPIWGWGEQGTKVTVTFGNQKKSTTIQANGKWMISLAPLTASAKSAQMTIKLGDETKTINDVLVGEVWLCSGQSNMDFTIDHIIKGALKTPKNKPIVDYILKEATTAKDPLLRQISVPHAYSYQKQRTDFKGNWIDCQPENNRKFTAVGYYFGRELRMKLKVPVGLIESSWGGSRLEPWIMMDTYQQSKSEMGDYYRAAVKKMDQAIEKWDPEVAKKNYKKQLTLWKDQGGKSVKGKLRRKPRMAGKPNAGRQFPSAMANAMIHPLVPYAIKGTIWYQGESNAGFYPDVYASRFISMIEGWRKAWGQGDFPFYYVQLANYKKIATRPKEKDGWATICDQQRLTLKLKNTGMAVINDIGEARDIHPKNKIDTGKRLALWALAKDYGNKDLVFSGPLYEKSQFSGNKVTITFSSSGGGLMVGKKSLMEPTVKVDAPLKGFQICGADRQWKWADAKIVGKSQVEVTHPDISSPVEVRYAWAANPGKVNLYNKEGLPTSIFKTTEKQ